MLACFSELIDYSDKRTRDEIRSIPDGTYTHEEPVLDVGACGGPYKLKLKLVKSGRDICFYFTGPAPQLKRPITCPLATTLSSLYYIFRSLSTPAIPFTLSFYTPSHFFPPPSSLF